MDNWTFNQDTGEIRDHTGSVVATSTMPEGYTTSDEILSVMESEFRDAVDDGDIARATDIIFAAAARYWEVTQN